VLFGSQLSSEGESAHSISATLVANNTFLAQAKHNPERGELLVEQRRGLWDFPQFNRLQIEVEQKVEQSLAPPFFISVSIAAKYRGSCMRSSLQHRKAPFFKTGGYEPIGITGDEQSDEISNPNWLLSLVFDEAEIAGNQILNLAFCSVIAGPE
jgi:hypothetical protein